jgi:hypothetical protein
MFPIVHCFRRWWKRRHIFIDIAVSGVRKSVCMNLIIAAIIIIVETRSSEQH